MFSVLQAEGSRTWGLGGVQGWGCNLKPAPAPSVALPLGTGLSLGFSPGSQNLVIRSSDKRAGW